MTWVWAFSLALLVALAVVPVMARQVTKQRGEIVTERDRASSLMSELEAAIDAAPSDAAGRDEAERCMLLSGAALGRVEVAEDYRTAARYARQGLAALGVTES